MKYFVSIIFIFLTTLTSAQFIKVEGVVIDNISQVPVPYVHISINSGIGTISNINGEFRLAWEVSVAKGTELYFSSVGYKPFILSLNDSNVKSYLEIELLPSITLLDEVTISSEEKVDSALLIIQKALKNIRKNYPMRKYGMEAFYREANISDISYSRLIEAQLLIADKGYNKAIETVEMNVLQMRKTEDNRDISWRQSLFEWLYNINGAFKTLANDRVKLSTRHYNMSDYEENKNGWIQYDRNGHEGSIRFLSKEFIEGCDWELKGVLKSENDTTYILQYEAINKNKHRSFARVGKGIIYVSKADWGIKEVSSEVVKPEGLRYNQLDYTLKGSRAYYKTIIKYQKHEGKYYLAYIKSESIGTNSLDFTGGRDLSLFEKTKGKLGKIYQENELFVTRILPYKKVSKKNRMDKEDDLYNSDATNDEAFWATYNYPMLNPLSDIMKTDLKNNDGELFIKE